MFWHLFYLVAGWEHLDSSKCKKRDSSSYGFLTGRVFKHACQWLFRWFHPVNKHLQQRPVKSHVGQTAAPTQQLKKRVVLSVTRSRKLAWLIEGCPVVFLLEAVSRPHREEKRLRRLLKVRGTAWLRFLMLLSVRADTWGGKNEWNGEK